MHDMPAKVYRVQPNFFFASSYSTGDIFEGFFSAGLRKGSGRLHMVDGSRREGSWIRDLLHGFVFFHKAASAKGAAVKVERWEKGRRIGDGATERDTGGNNNNPRQGQPAKGVKDSQQIDKEEMSRYVILFNGKKPTYY